VPLQFCACASEQRSSTSTKVLNALRAVLDNIKYVPRALMGRVLLGLVQWLGCLPNVAAPSRARVPNITHYGPWCWNIYAN